MNIQHYIEKWQLTIILSTLLLSSSRYTADKLFFQTIWYVQTKQCGYFQALSQVICEKYGLDEVVTKVVGPDVKNMSLLLSKRADIIINYDLQVLKGIESSFPIKVVVARFQLDPQDLLTYSDVKSLVDLKRKTIIVSTSVQANWWIQLKRKYKLYLTLAGLYKFDLQPFFAAKNIVLQAVDL